MTEKLLPAAVRQNCERIVTQTPFLQHLGVQLCKLEWGHCTLEMPICPEHLQQDGFVHAGVQATLADHACGTAAAACMTPEQQVLSIEFKLNLLRPAQGDTLRAVAEVIKPGRRVTVVEASVYACTQGQTKLCSKMLGTMAVMDLGPKP